MMQVIEMTHSEKVEMYQMVEKDRLIEMLIEANNVINRLTEVKNLRIADVSSMLPDQTKRYIDLAYLTGVFNVSGIDGLQKELTRLKDIGKNPHDIFTEGNYR
jgi:hypothetical protein